MPSANRSPKSSRPKACPPARSLLPPAAPTRRPARRAPAAKPKIVITVDRSTSRTSSPSFSNEPSAVVQAPCRSLGTPVRRRSPACSTRAPAGGRGAAGFRAASRLVAVVGRGRRGDAAPDHGALPHASCRLAPVPEQGMRSLIHLGLLALLDGLGVFVVWLICHGAVGAWFTGAHRPGQARRSRC